jgi:ribonuclease HI
VTVWCKNWERNDWQTSLKQPVLNKDLIQGVLAKIRDREALGAATRFFWIKGHSNNPGNEAADRLAVLGAQKPNMD